MTALGLSPPQAPPLGHAPCRSAHALSWPPSQGPPRQRPRGARGPRRRRLRTCVVSGVRAATLRVPGTPQAAAVGLGHGLRSQGQCGVSGARVARRPPSATPCSLTTALWLPANPVAVWPAARSVSPQRRASRSPRGAPSRRGPGGLLCTRALAPGLPGRGLGTPDPARPGRLAGFRGHSAVPHRGARVLLPPPRPLERECASVTPQRTSPFCFFFPSDASKAVVRS